jgi:hypothetical protein
VVHCSRRFWARGYRIPIGPVPDGTGYPLEIFEKKVDPIIFISATNTSEELEYVANNFRKLLIT